MTLRCLVFRYQNFGETYSIQLYDSALKMFLENVNNDLTD
jgi:hypothetical protein